MRTTIDRAGRLVVPKAIRDRLQLSEGGEVDVVEHDGRIEVRPVPASVTIVDTPDGPVAEPVDQMPVLTDAMVRETLDRVRR